MRNETEAIYSMTRWDNMDKPHSRFTHLYALIRYDVPLDSENLHSSVSVIKIFANRADAEEEANRLGSINDRTKCVYQVQVTRFADEG
jgi:hypothetical protein